MARLIQWQLDVTLEMTYLPTSWSRRHDTRPAFRTTPVISRNGHFLNEIDIQSSFRNEYT